MGKFVSYIVDGCPDGYMTIFERDLPNIGGQWCGSAWGYTVYYSETPSINLTLFLSKLSEQVSADMQLYFFKFVNLINYYASFMLTTLRKKGPKMSHTRNI